jgi:urea transport system ATP-binding protein
MDAAVPTNAPVPAPAPSPAVDAAASAAIALDVSGINQFYGESHTLWDAGVVVPRGACVCLMGRNGVGKTTLLKVIMGLLPIHSGTMRFGDKPLPVSRPELRARMGIGYVPQGREIFPQLTVEENLPSRRTCAWA